LGTPFAFWEAGNTQQITLGFKHGDDDVGLTENFSTSGEQQDAHSGI
jgi:hypothetical protein